MKRLALRLSISETALLHGRLLSELEGAFGRPIRQAEAKALVVLIRRIGRPEVHARLGMYAEALRTGIARPATAAEWIKRHGLWEVHDAG